MLIFLPSVPKTKTIKILTTKDAKTPPHIADNAPNTSFTPINCVKIIPYPAMLIGDVIFNINNIKAREIPFFFSNVLLFNDFISKEINLYAKNNNIITARMLRTKSILSGIKDTILFAQNAPRVI